MRKKPIPEVKEPEQNDAACSESHLCRESQNMEVAAKIFLQEKWQKAEKHIHLSKMKREKEKNPKNFLFFIFPFPKEYALRLHY